ncbi:DUF2992 family protein [Paraeggerthella sp. LCP19S3_G8]|uniref:DUF2992 family protein n=1 Tax=Paraeggerthella sp. LCP19S3_G8 TaxID=3440248 RepID=UPI003F9971F4
MSSTLTLYHDGRFWAGIVEWIKDGRLQAARIVFGTERRRARSCDLWRVNGRRCRSSVTKGLTSRN